MAGTRGLPMFRGRQLNTGIMRDRHFDETNKINEKYVDIDFNSHRETLVDTKIEVFSQVMSKTVAGLGSIDITADLGGKAVATNSNDEGVVLSRKVELRQHGTEDFPFIDLDGDRVYGRITEDAGTYTLTFYSEENDVETPYTFADDVVDMDFRYVLRTNMSVIPVDAILNGGASFIEGATDANAYMNLKQLMVDLYGATGTLDNDGNANLATSIIKQIADEINSRTQADADILDDFISNEDGKGANLIGIEVDPDGNYLGTTVQAVITELATKVKDNQDGLNDRVTKLETKPEEEVFEAVGGETQYLLAKGKAEDKSVLLFLNGQALAPGVNFTYIRDGDGNIIGFDFTPDTLQVTDGVPDVIYVKYSKVI